MLFSFNYIILYLAQHNQPQI